jgi:hypothetical protein
VLSEASCEDSFGNCSTVTADQRDQTERLRAECNEAIDVWHDRMKGVAHIWEEGKPPRR